MFRIRIGVFWLRKWLKIKKIALVNVFFKKYYLIVEFILYILN